MPERPEWKTSGPPKSWKRALPVQIKHVSIIVLMSSQPWHKHNQTDNVCSLRSHMKAPEWAITLLFVVPDCSLSFSSHCFKLSAYTCTGAIDFPRTFFPFRVILGSLQQHWQREMKTLGGIKSGWPLSRKTMGRKTQSYLNRTKRVYFWREREGDGKQERTKES